MKQFCRWQITAREDLYRTGKQVSWTCTANLAESRALQCPYLENEIYQDGTRMTIAHRDEGGRPHTTCEDFQFPEGKNIIKLLPHPKPHYRQDRSKHPLL